MSRCRDDDEGDARSVVDDLRARLDVRGSQLRFAQAGRQFWRTTALVLMFATFVREVLRLAGVTP